MTLTAKSSTTLREGQRGGGFVEAGFIGGNPQHGRRLAVVAYDIAVDGSPIPHATAGMGTKVFLPANALVLFTWTQVITAVVGPTNIYQSLEANGDLLVSGTIAANEFDTAGDVVIGSVIDVVAGGSSAINVETVAVVSASKVQTTVSREVIFGCTVTAITAGKFVTFVEYAVVA